MAERKGGGVKHTGMFPFIHLFPGQGTAEMRSFIVGDSPELPGGEYGLLELYCVEAGCNCRRVMLSVIGRQQQAILASIGFAFDPDDDYPGPFLDPLNPQSEYAGVLLEWVEEILADSGYVARLEAHYYQVKGAVNDPNHACHQILVRAPLQAGLRQPPRQSTGSKNRKRRGR